MRSPKIIVFILIILLAIPPFFYGGNGFFIRGMVFVLAGLAGLLFIFGVKSVGHLMGRPTLAARTIAPQSAVRLHTEYGASEVAEDLNPLTSPFGKGGVETPLRPPLQGGNNSPLLKGGEGGLLRIVYQSSFILLFLYLLFGLISVFSSVSPYESAALWLEHLSYGLLFFIIARRNFGRREIEILIKTFLAVSAVLSIIGIYFYIVGSYSRLTSLFWWPNPFAGYLLFALFLGLEWVLDNNSHQSDNSVSDGKENPPTPLYKGGIVTIPFLKGGIFPVLFLSIILSSFILTGSRGAFLSFLIVLPVYFYFKYLQLAGARNYKSPQPPLLKGEKLGNAPLIKARFAIALARRGVRGIINILAVILLSIIFIFIINFLKNDNFSFASHIKESGTQSDFSSGIRLKYWQGAWEMFRDRPLTGWGGGTFGAIYHLYQKDPISSGKYAHNWYLEMLAEQGIFTAIFFVLFLVSVLFIFLNPLTSPLYPAAAGGTQKPPYIPLYKGEAIRPPFQRGDRGVYSLDKEGYALSFFAGILAFLIHNGVDIDWHFPAVAVIFWIFSGLLYNISRGEQRLFFCHPEPASGEGSIIRENSIKQLFVESGVLKILQPLRRLQNDKKNFIIFFTLLLIFSGVILFHGGYFYEQGLKFKEKNNLPEAEIAFKKSVFLNSDPDYLRELGIIKYSRALNMGGAAGMELLNQALAISEKIMKYDSYDALNYELAGRVYLARGDSGEAEKNFRKAVELNKFNPRHYINLASLLISENRKEEARYLINKVLSYYPAEVVGNKKMYIMPNQEITSGIEKDIEYLRYLLNMANNTI